MGSVVLFFLMCSVLLYGAAWTVHKHMVLWRCCSALLDASCANHCQAYSATFISCHTHTLTGSKNSHTHATKGRMPANWSSVVYPLIAPYRRNWLIEPHRRNWHNSQNTKTGSPFPSCSLFSLSVSARGDSYHSSYRELHMNKSEALNKK